MHPPVEDFIDLYLVWWYSRYALFARTRARVGGGRKSSFQYSIFSRIFDYIVVMLLYVDLDQDV